MIAHAKADEADFVKQLGADEFINADSLTLFEVILCLPWLPFSSEVLLQA